MKKLGFFLQMIGLFLVLVFYVTPTFMIPFVHELPYLHFLSLWQRVQISAVVLSVAHLLIMLGTPPERRKAVVRLTNGVKGMIGMWLGFLAFMFLGAYLNANIMGLLVRDFPNQPCVYHVVVDRAKYQGSRNKYESVYLSLHSAVDHKPYYLTLAKKRFNYPDIQAGDQMILYGQQNLFGVYVNKFTVYGKSMGSTNQWGQPA